LPSTRSTNVRMVNVMASMMSLERVESFRLGAWMTIRQPYNLPSELARCTSKANS